MVSNVVKRDGALTKFDLKKIVDAIMAAMHEVNDVNGKDAGAIAKRIHNTKKTKLGVEEIQDMVEMDLMEKHPKVAKAYITYRNERSRKRRTKSQMMKMVKEKVFASNVVNSNANVDEYSFGGRKNEAAGVVEKEIADESLLDETVKKYKDNNLLYIHDYTEYPIGDHNCLFADIGRLTLKGFDTRNGGVRGARSFSTACQLVAVIFQIQSQNQFGGVASAHIDDDLAPFVRMSFLRHFKDGLKYVDQTNASYDEFKAKYRAVQLKTEDDKTNFVEDAIINRASICAEVNIFNDYSYPAYNYAMDMLEKEGMQSAEALYHNLNTLESRPGSQLPFTSINFGLNTTFEGRCVTRWLLNASIEGIGEHHFTPIFPISIFKYKKGINDKPGTKNYDLYQLAIKSLTKRIYPNIVNCDWVSNKPDKNPETTPHLSCDIPGSSSILRGPNKDKVTISELFRSIPTTYTVPSGKKIITLKDVRSLNIIIADHHPLSAYSDYLTQEYDVEDIITKILFIAYDKSARAYSITTESSTYAIQTKGEKFLTCVYNAYPSYDPDTEMATMGCRTLIGYDVNGMGYKKTGRGNITPITMVLPKLGIEYGICLGKRETADVEGFFKAFGELLDVAEKSLVDRYNYICSQNVRAGRFMYSNGDIAEGKKAWETGNVEVAMRHGTLAFGYIGIANTCYAMFGSYHNQTKEAYDFAMRIIDTIAKKAKAATKEHHLNFSVYSSPAENCCYSICSKLKAEYGEIKGVTDKEYLTNSLHIPVFENISIDKKLKLEAKLAKPSTGGEINYVELESSVIHNHPAVEKIINYAMKTGIPYLAINFPIDNCADCGASVAEMDSECPICHSHKIYSLRRVTGYLSTDYHNFNDGKIEEVKDRVKHTSTSFVK